jgi:DNA-binding transcriptional LysR family regulator
MTARARDLDLRKLRYFVVLAQSLNFGRAAEELHIAQPVLSRQIKALEHELRVRLFDRDSRGTTLTDAGEQLLQSGKLLLASASALQVRLDAVAAPVRTITVGVMPGLLATAAATAFESAHPSCRVVVRRIGWDDQLDVVRNGTADIVYARDPEPEADLDVTPLLQEGRDVVLPLGHELGTRARVTPDDLKEVLLLQDVAVAPEWQAVATPRMRREAARLEHAATVEEKLERVASGRGFVILPRSTTAAYRRPDVVIVPADRFAPSRVGLVTLRAVRDPLRDAFARTAFEHASRSTSPL